MSSVASFAAVMERTNSRGTTVVNQDREEIAGMSCKEKNRERERGERETERYRERDRESERERDREQDIRQERERLMQF